MEPSRNLVVLIWQYDLSYNLLYNRALVPPILFVYAIPFSERFIMSIIPGTYLRIYYIPNSYFLFYLSIDGLEKPAIECLSWRLFLSILLLFCYPIKSSKAQDVSSFCNCRDKCFTAIISAAQLISTCLLKKMTLLKKWDMAWSKISWTQQCLGLSNIL